MLAQLLALTGSPVRLFYAVGLTISSVGIVAEAGLAAVTGRPLYNARDTAANLAMYAGYFVVNLAWTHAMFDIYTWFAARAVVHVPIGGWHLGGNGLWWEWLLLVLLEDLCFYWFHRASHRSRILWASHVSHHSSQTFNLSVAF